MIYRRGLGSVLPAVSPLGYQWWDGSPIYHSEGAFQQGMPSNCDNGAGANPRNLPADGAPCVMALFPFVGHKEHGCGSKAVSGGYGDPYVRCKPVFLAGGGFMDFTPMIRLAATAAIGWVLLSSLGGRR